MNPTANDYSSPDPARNISLTEADQFRDRLAGALALEFGNRYVKTTTGAVVTESEVRQNAGPAQPVNVWGTLADPTAVEINVAEWRASIRAAALGQNPVGDLENALKQALPQSDVQSILLRATSIQSAVRSTIVPI
ncbi:MAG TPA: hypothetical protein VNX70_03865 [Bryobacteraceae bacterium]|jgi:hypothetical protein|nr:hypothetical protein [Bryobacteraceae bacterium]HXA63723.1 hypothetical protein [Bryobacteraceae bacterium]